MAERLVQRGLLYGSAVAAQSSPDMTVQVAAGGVLYDNIPATAVADTVVAITAADTDTAATLATTLGIVNAEILYTADASGDDGNLITVEYRDPRAASQSLDVTVYGTAITVSLATNSSSVVTSTASSVITAVNADTEAGALVTAANAPANTGAGVVAWMPSQALTGGHTGGDRYDVVGRDSTGAIVVVEGTAGTPGPDDMAALADITDAALIQVPAGATTITTSEISDPRGFIAERYSPYKVSSLWYGPLGLSGTYNVWASGDMFLVPYWVAKEFSIQAIGCSGGGGTAGSKGRLGIYRDDGSGGLSLLVDAGQAALDGAGGAKTLSTSQTLTPGWWWFALAFQSLGVTKPTMGLCGPGGFSPIGADSINSITAATYSTGASYGGIYHTGVTGALPATPTSPSYSASRLPGVWVQAT